MAKFVNFNSASTMKLPTGVDDSVFSKIKSAGGKMNTTAIVAVVAVFLFGLLAFFIIFTMLPQNEGFL